MRFIVKKLFHLIVALLLISQTACDPKAMLEALMGAAANRVLNSAFVSPTVPAGPAANGDDTGNNATDETSLGDDDDDDDDANVLPQASIPLPPGLENTSTSSADASGSLVSQGNVGIDNAGNSLVIASEFGASLQPRWKSFFASFNQAMATSSACPEDMDFEACVTIGEDGTYLATLANADEGAELQFYIYNPQTGLISEPATDSPNTNLVHVGNDILNITSDGAGNLYGLSDEGKFVTVEYVSADGTLRVSGDVEEGYSFAQISGATQAVYNAASPTTGAGTFVVNNDSVVTEYQIDSGTATSTGVTSELYCVVADGCNAKTMKLKNDNLYHGSFWDEGSDEETGRIYELYSGNVLQVLIAGSSHEMTDLLSIPDIDRSPRFQNTKAYDVYLEDVSSLRVAVAVVENDDDRMRLIAKMDATDDWYITIDGRLDSQYTDVYDLQVLNEQDDDDITDGRGVFTSNIGVTFFDFDASEYNSSDATPDSGFVIGPDIEIANTVSMTVNTDKTIGYVISSGDTASVTDDIITVVDLTGEIIKTGFGRDGDDADEIGDGVIYLSDYLPNKTVTDLSPRTITYFTQDGAEFLLVTLGNTEAAFRDSAIVIEL